MRLISPWLACVLSALLIGGCSTTYKPMVVDPKTGLYDTLSSVSPGGVAIGKTDVAFEDFAAIVLVADSNRYPSRLEFVARKALADLGFRNVINVPELLRWAEDQKFSFSPERITLDALRDFSTTVRPVLIVDVRYAWLGDMHHFGGMRVIDGRSGEALLTVNHPKSIFLSVDQEVIYPVLNELRKWHQKVAAKGA